MSGAQLPAPVSGSTRGLSTPPPQAAAAPPAARDVAASGALAELCALSPRELRQIPTIGDRRAVAIARRSWELVGAGEPLALTDLPGIGPKTAAAVEAWLRARGKKPPGAGSARSAERTLADPPP